VSYNVKPDVDSVVGLVFVWFQLSFSISNIKCSSMVNLQVQNWALLFLRLGITYKNNRHSPYSEVVKSIKLCALNYSSSGFLDPRLKICMDMMNNNSALPGVLSGSDCLPDKSSSGVLVD